MLNTGDKILINVSKRGRGSVVFPRDFAAYGDAKTIQKAFERLVASGKFIKIAHGIYCYPKIDKHLGLGILYPTFEEVATAIAKRDNAKIVPTGVYALHKLGLSTQIPMNATYLTDGSARKIKIDNGRGVQFIHTAKKNLGFQNDFAMLLTFALRELGENHLTEEQLKHIKSLVQKIPFDQIKNDFKLIPAWIQRIIRSAYE